jgi:spoIIIJ-associated protein
MEEQQQQAIKEIILELVRKTGIQAELDAIEADGVTVFNVHTPDSGILIGQHGTSLAALQYLARILAYKKVEGPTHFVVDVEDYKKGREEFLRELGRQAAERVRETHESLLLKPMMSYERRIVHEAISEFSDVTTESQGEDPERRILIKPLEK